MQTSVLIDSMKAVWRARPLVAAAAALTLGGCDDPIGPPLAATHPFYASDAAQPPRDASPHREGFVTANGATLHYLDWGGHGVPLVLLTGLGETAHVFDDIAPKLTPHYRVVALTRRGFGQSSRPTSGFDVNSLVDDDVAVLDALQLGRAYVAGHSIAAHEMTRLAVRHPERVARLVYLDGSLNDRTRSEACTGVSEGPAEPSGVTFAPPAPTAADAASFTAATLYFHRLVPGPWSAALTNNLRHLLTIQPDGSVRDDGDPVAAALMAAGICGYRHEFGAVQAPALAIVAVAGTPADVLPWLPATMGADSTAAARHVLDVQQASARANAALFAAEVPDARVVLVPDANHYLFIEQQRQVVAAMRDFLPKRLDPPPGRPR